MTGHHPDGIDLDVLQSSTVTEVVAEQTVQHGFRFQFSFHLHVTLSPAAWSCPHLCCFAMMSIWTLLGLFV